MLRPPPHQMGEVNHTRRMVTQLLKNRPRLDLEATLCLLMELHRLEVDIQDPTVLRR